MELSLALCDLNLVREKGTAKEKEKKISFPVLAVRLTAE